MRLINHDRQRRILGLSKRIDELAAARFELHRQLVDLDEQASAAQREHDSLYNLEAPISSLPDETLAAIFEEGTYIPGASESSQFRVLVSHVTQHWRTVAVATPKLWSSILFTIYRLNDPSYHEDLIGRASTFLSRARSSPLDISFTYFRESHFSSDILQLISDNIGYCRQLRIVDGGYEGLAKALRCISSQSMPLLASIDLSCIDGNIEFRELLFPPGSHRLTTARIHNFAMHTMHFCLPVFESLTALQLAGFEIEGYNDDVQYRALRNALMALSSLRHLELMVYVFSTLSLPDRLPILLPTIEHLHVKGSHSSGFDGILCSIQATSLVALSVSVQHPGQFYPLHAGTFDFPSLQHLFLTDVGRAKPDLVAFVAFARNFPHIKHLTFESGNVADRLLHDIDRILYSILYGDGDLDRAIDNVQFGLLWPELQSIALSATVERPDFEASKVRSTILKLRAAGHPIRKLLLPRKAHPAMDELREMIEIEEFYLDWPTPFDW